MNAIYHIPEPNALRNYHPAHQYTHPIGLRGENIYSTVQQPNLFQSVVASAPPTMHHHHHHGKL
jgi:hypothetical protein